MLSKEAIEDFKKDGYTFEEISRISKSLECIEKGELIPFEDVIRKVYSTKKVKKTCIK